MPDIPEKPKTFGKWLENFWYHYKVQTIIAVVLIITVVFGIYQITHRKKIDMTVYYICRDPVVVDESTSALTQTLQHYATDYDGDGIVNVVINTLFIGDDYDNELVKENISNFSSAYQGGGVMLIITDAYGANFIAEKGWFGDISDIAPNTEYSGTVFNAEGSDFITQDSMKYWDNRELYFGLRVYNENSFINIQKDSKARYEYAKSILQNIINNKKVS